MKLRPIVASMMVLGLSAPAFAATSAAANESAQAQIDGLKAQLNKMEAMINSQSAGGYFQPADWMNRISVSGMVNVDGAWSNRRFVPVRSDTPNNGGYRTNLDVNNANLFVDAVVNDWTKAHLSLQYDAGLSDNFSRRTTTSASSSAKAANGGFNMDEAYVTIGNFAQSPVFFRAGKEYVPFGQYQRYPMVENPTQLLSQTSAVAAQLGVVTPVGFYASGYTFRGTSQSTSTDADGRSPRVANFGANVGYAYCQQDWGIKADAGYIRNMIDVDFINSDTGATRTSYTDRVAGVALSVDARVQQFDGSLRYVAALDTFNATDVSFQTTNGAQPKAYGAEAGFSFPVVNNHNSRVAVGYQRTKEAAQVGVGLPETRWYGTYTVNISKWVDVGFEYIHDQDYNVTDGGIDRAVNAGVVRVGVKFA